MTPQRQFRVFTGGTEMPPEMPPLRVAFATGDMSTVDQHFGSARAFAIYAVGSDDASVVEVVQFGTSAHDGNEDKLIGKLDALGDCAAVYVQAVGGSAVAQLVSRGIEPIAVDPGTRISLLIANLGRCIKTGTLPWRTRARAGQRDENRFDLMEAEGWDE